MTLPVDPFSQASTPGGRVLEQGELLAGAITDAADRDRLDTALEALEPNDLRAVIFAGVMRMAARTDLERRHPSHQTRQSEYTFVAPDEVASILTAALRPPVARRLAAAIDRVPDDRLAAVIHDLWQPCDDPEDGQR